MIKKVETCAAVRRRAQFINMMMTLRKYEDKFKFLTVEDIGTIGPKSMIKIHSLTAERLGLYLNDLYNMSIRIDAFRRDEAKDEEVLSDIMNDMMCSSFLVPVNLPQHLVDPRKLLDLGALDNIVNKLTLLDYMIKDPDNDPIDNILNQYIFALARSLYTILFDAINVFDKNFWQENYAPIDEMIVDHDNNIFTLHDEQVFKSQEELDAEEEAERKRIEQEERQKKAIEEGKKKLELEAKYEEFIKHTSGWERVSKIHGGAAEFMKFVENFGKLCVHSVDGTGPVIDSVRTFLGSFAPNVCSERKFYIKVTPQFTSEDLVMTLNAMCDLVYTPVNSVQKWKVAGIYASDSETHDPLDYESSEPVTDATYIVNFVFMLAI